MDNGTFSSFRWRSTSPRRSPSTTNTSPDANTAEQQLHRIVVVGGGAGGLGIVTRLGDRPRRRGPPHNTLIDGPRKQPWKPRLQELRAGTLRLDRHALAYDAQTH